MGFKKKESREMPEMNTSSLPDLIFTILFFFMMVTTMREVTLKCEKPQLPKGSELEKLENKACVSTIYIGRPLDKRYGSTHQIQLNDAFPQQPGNVIDWLLEEREKMSAKHQDQTKQIISIKADADAPMEGITEIKKFLRKAWALKISYSAEAIDRR